MRNEPCKQCGSSDFYFKGEFSYCRPCHKEAQKRYAENKRAGLSYESAKPAPQRTLSSMLTKAKLTPTHCPRNHPYRGDNLRVEYPSHANHQIRCKACERDAKRVRYGLQPDPDPTRLSDLLDDL